MGLILATSFEGGTNGTAITTGNSGGLSGTAFDLVVGTSPTYAAASAIFGSLGMSSPLAAVSTSAAGWSTSFGTGFTTEFWARDYFKVGSAPPGVIRLAETLGSSTARWGIAVDTSGKVGVRNLSTGTFTAEGTTVLTAAASNRYEFDAAYNGTTWVVTLRLFYGANFNGATPDETVTSTAMTLGAVDTFSFGALASSSFTWSGVSHDNVAISSSGYLGPVNSYTLGLAGAVTAIAGSVAGISKQVAAGVTTTGISHRVIRRPLAAVLATAAGWIPRPLVSGFPAVPGFMVPGGATPGEPLPSLSMFTLALAATILTAAAVARRLGRALSATVAAVGGLVAAGRHLLTLAGQMTAQASLPRRAGRAVAAAVATSAGLARSAGCHLAAAVFAAAVLGRAATRNLPATMVTAAAVTRRMARVVVAQVLAGGEAAAARSTLIVVAATMATAAGIRRGLATRLAALVTVAGTGSRIFPVAVHATIKAAARISLTIPKKIIVVYQVGTVRFKWAASTARQTWGTLTARWRWPSGPTRGGG